MSDSDKVDVYEIKIDESAQKQTDRRKPPDRECRTTSVKRY